MSSRPAELQRTSLARVVDSPAFGGVILAVILGNSVVLGAQTYEGLTRDHGDLLDLLDEIFLWVFVGELVIRIASYRRPWDFFRDPWNIFDFVVIGAAFFPGLRENSTLLRLARLLRVVRIIRILPDLRVLIIAIARSLPPLASMSLLTAVLLFVYGMIGWLLFGDEDPENWANIGEAMLTLFIMLTLENWPNVLETDLAIHSWAWIYFVSFILIAAFIVINVLIGVVLHSMEEAREIHAREALEEQGIEPTEEQVEIAARISALRSALDDLERDLVAAQHRAGEVSGGPAPGTTPATG